MSKPEQPKLVVMGADMELTPVRAFAAKRAQPLGKEIEGAAKEPLPGKVVWDFAPTGSSIRPPCSGNRSYLALIKACFFVVVNPLLRAEQSVHPMHWN